MAQFPQEIYHLLYENDGGREIGLDQVMTLEPIPIERVAPLRALLDSPDLFLAFQAVLVLTAWGDTVGLAKAEEMIDTRVDRKAEIAPHRIYDEDNAYDEMAYAVELCGQLPDNHSGERERLFRKMLALYGPCYFESKLKFALLESNLVILITDVRAAMDRAAGLGREYMASQLLPVLAKWSGEAVWPSVRRFAALPAQTPDPQSNVAEALGYLPPGDESRRLLERLSESPSRAVATEARRILAKAGG